MKYTTLNILVWLICNSFPLKLYVSEEKVLTSSSISKNLFVIFCRLHGRYIKD